MSRRGRPPAPRVTFEAVKRADGWHVLAVDCATYKPRTIKIFPARDGDRAREAVKILTQLVSVRAVDMSQADITRSRQLLLPGRQRTTVDEIVELYCLIYGVSEEAARFSLAAWEWKP